MTTSPDPLGAALAERGLERTRRVGAVTYRGRSNGRGIELHVSRVGRTTYADEMRIRRHLGHKVRIEMETQLPVRLFFVPRAIAESSWIRTIYRWRRQIVIPEPPRNLEEHRVVARDLHWARALLQDDRSMQEVASLLNEGWSSRGANIHFSPGALNYGSPTLQPEHFVPDRWIAVLDRLDRLAAAAERLPEPQVRDQRSRLEAFGREQPLLAGAMFLGGILGCAFVPVALLVLVARVLSSFGGG